MKKRTLTVSQMLETFAQKAWADLKGLPGPKRPPTAKMAAQLLRAGIMGVGFGLKETEGNLTPEQGVRVYVRDKKPRSSLPNSDIIPPELTLKLGDASRRLFTDVVPTGYIWPGWIWPGAQRQGWIWPGSQGSEWLSKDLAMLRGPYRTMTCGLSVGVDGGGPPSAGTLGCIVKAGGRQYLLSNNHVLAEGRLAGRTGSPANGARIYQPALLDRSDPYIAAGYLHGNRETVPVAELSHVVDILPYNPSKPNTVSPNFADVALAKVTDTVAVGSPASTIFSLPQSPGSSSFATLNPPAMPNDRTDLLFTTVGKVGRTTGLTLGVIVDVYASFWLPYGAEDDLSHYAWFERQIAVVPLGSYPTFSAPGDSGSAVFAARDRKWTGLLFAGGTGITFVNPVDLVLSQIKEHTGLDVSLA